MTYLFDTNIVLHYLRRSPLRSYLEETLSPSAVRNTVVISVVTAGEIYSIAIQRNWGAKRLIALDNFLSEFLIADINSEDIIQAYAQIDAFSQGKLPGRTLETSARNMGKNDLWIAATAHVLNATLLTTDLDFGHLNGTFLNLKEVRLSI